MFILLEIVELYEKDYDIPISKAHGGFEERSKVSAVKRNDLMSKLSILDL